LSTTRFFKNSGIYALASFFQKTINFLLLPVYTLYLTPHDYGILNIVFSVSTFLSVMLLLSLQAAATRYHYDRSILGFDIKSIWGTIVILVLGITIVFALLFLFFGKYIFSGLIGNVPYKPYVVIGLIYTLLSPLYLLFQFYLQASQNAKKYGINLMTNFLINVCIIIVFLIYFHLKALGILYAYLITSALFFVYTIIIFFPKISFKFNKSIAIKSIKYSLPLLPHSLAGWSMSMLDRVFVNSYKGTSETGIYSVGAQMSSIVNTITTAVYQAYSPWFFQKLYEKENFQDLNNKIVLLICKVYFILGVLMSFIAEPIVKLITTSKFWDGWKFIPLLVWAYILSGIYFFLVAPLFIKNTKYIPIITLTASGINVLAFVTLIPIFGTYGAGIGTFLAFAVSNIMALLMTRKLERSLLINYGHIYLLFFISICVSFMVYFIKFNSWYINLIFRISIILIFTISILWNNKKDIKEGLNLMKLKIIKHKE